MNDTQSPNASNPIQARMVFLFYAMIFGLAGLVVFMSDAGMSVWICIGPAACAALLAAVTNPRVQRRLLFWFAMANAAACVLALSQIGGAWGSRLGTQGVSVLGIAALLLFYLWLTAEGDLPDTPLVGPRIFGKPVSRSPRSELERRLREAGAQEERNRLARDLHDSIKQQIFAIQTAAATAQTRFEGDQSGAREALDQIRRSAREAMTEMEVMLDQLRAAPLENTGLVEALKKLCEAIGFRTGAQVDFRLGAPPPRMPAPGAAHATLRVAQEALANVARHARASHVLVSLDSGDGRMQLTIRDDGAGFEPTEASRGMGMANMRTRAEEFGGCLDIDTARGSGTTVTFSIPYQAADAARRRRKNLARVAYLGFATTAPLLDRVTHHWIWVPAMASIAAMAVAHYLKSDFRARRLTGTAS